MRSQFLMYKLKLLTAKTFPNFVGIDQFLRDLLRKQIYKQKDKFKLSHASEINNSF